MALVKCPDCEKMVSPRVDRCPFCGCPAEFFQKMQETNKTKKSEEANTQTAGTEGRQNENKKGPEKHISFDLCGVDVEFSVYIEKFAQLFGTYLKAGDEAYAEMLRLYKEAGSISKALETLPGSAEDFIFGVIDEGTKFLYKQGVNITQEKFFQKHNRKYPMSYSVYFERVVEKYSDISGAKAELAAYREAQKTTRGRWSGGGFGLKGAIKGAAAASVLNMGDDFLHSFGDSAQRKEDNKKFSAEYGKLYRNSRETLCYSVKTCIMNVFYAMVEELENIRFFEETYALNKKEADTRYEAVVKYEQDKDEIFDKMIDCILDYPGERRFYEKIKDRLINEKSDIGAFLKFWNIEYLIADILKRKDEQDNFDHFMESCGILKFDFTDMSAKNVGSLLQWIAAYRKEAGKEYLKEIPSESRYADRIQNYLSEAVHSLEKWDYSILSWIPADATFREFWEIAAGEGERLGLYSVGGFSRHINSESGKKLLEKIKDGGTVLLCCDTSLLENYSKGLVVTEKYSMDLKTGNKVENNKISVIDFVKIKDSYGIRLSDGIREIAMPGGEDGAEWDFLYFKLVMGLVFVRYCGNRRLYKPSMGNVHAETDIKTPEYIKGYYSDPLKAEEERKERYLGLVKGKFSFDELEKMNLFRRSFKYLSGYNQGIRYDSPCYGFEADEEKIRNLVSSDASQYVLFYDGRHLITDRAVYVNGERYALGDVREFLCMGETADDVKGFLHVILKDGTQKIYEEGISFSDDVPSYHRVAALFLDINIIMESIWKNENVRFIEKELYCCRKCGSFDIESHFAYNKCRKCGNKKQLGFYTCAWSWDEGQRAKASRRSSLVNTALTSDEECKLLYDENRNYEWILELKERQELKPEQPAQAGRNVLITTDEKVETRPTVAEKAEAKPYIFCTSCGKRIQRTAKFCNFCGAKNSYGNAKKKPSEYDAYLAADNYLLKASKVYAIPNRGPVVNGTVVFGIVKLGGSIMILNPDGSRKMASIIGLKSGENLINRASEGTEVDIMLKGVEMLDIQKDALIKEGGHGNEMP